jgi:type I restriction enzyme S subunit
MSGRPRLGDFFSNRQEPGRPNLPVMSVTMNDSLVLRDDLERRTESALRPDQHLLVRKGDIAYNMMRMWQGACGLAAADGIVSPAYVVLAPRTGIDSGFAYHWFKTTRMVHFFWAYSHGLTEDRLRLYFDEFSEIPMMPPPIERQRRIVKVLDTWDRAIVTAEKLANAKGRQFLECQRRLLAVSPTEAWKRGCLGDLISSITSGVSVASEDRRCRDGEVGILKTSCVLTGVFRPEEHKAVTPAEISRVSGSVTADTVLVSRMNTPDLVGASSYVREGNGHLFLPDRLWQIRGKKNVSTRWLGFVIGSKEIRGHLKSIATGTSNSMKNISQESFTGLPVFIPPLVEQKRTAEALDLMEQELILSQKQVVRLQLQKRGLMQKLLPSDWKLDTHFDSTALVHQTELVGSIV